MDEVVQLKIVVAAWAPACGHRLTRGAAAVEDLGTRTQALPDPWCRCRIMHDAPASVAVRSCMARDLEPWANMIEAVLLWVFS